MNTSKEFKRYTLFFNRPEALSSDRMLEFITPLIKLGFLPQVHKGMEISVEGNGESIKSENIWSIDFIKQDSNGLTVSVTRDRVDIKYDSDEGWESFKEMVLPILSIVIPLAKYGFSRLAIGYEITEIASKDEAIEAKWLTNEEAERPELREKIDQKVDYLLLGLPDGNDPLPYNYVLKKTLNIDQEHFTFKTEYDINTILSIPSEIISNNLNIFFDSVISEFM